jgi:hypothetical protein
MVWLIYYNSLGQRQTKSFTTIDGAMDWVKGTTFELIDIAVSIKNI